ncbi:hypothetical protein ERJ75_000042900 [Trypanosoma vivax]|nr:hypothetical protein ERJ75_000042900 [Trypanosoma vivax]
MGFLNRLRDQRANESADNPECTRNDDGKSPSLDKVPNAFFEAEDIDSVVLDESAACVTSTMRAFFNYDIADVVPKVDNYFDGTGLTGEGEPDGRGDWQPDELVGGAPDNSEMGPQNGTGCAVVAEASSKRHVDPDTNCDAYFTTTVDESGDYSSSNSSYGEIELPGFDGFGKPPHHLTGAVQWDQQFLSWGNGHFLSREDVATLRTDGDEVRPFSVDPYFDYDAIVVGKSVRPFPYLSA